LEIFFFPGVAIVAVTGLGMMLGSLVWAMADLWPGVPLSVAWSGDAFITPLQNLGFGLLLAAVLGVVLARFLPEGWIWDRMIVRSAISGSAQLAGGPVNAAHEIAALIGAEAVAVTALRPSGQIEIGGRRFEAKIEVGSIDAGELVRVCGRTDFGLIVEKVSG
jgi:membrane-bound serine protease (ClpP class)